MPFASVSAVVVPPTEAPAEESMVTLVPASGTTLPKASSRTTSTGAANSTPAFGAAGGSDPSTKPSRTAWPGVSATLWVVASVPLDAVKVSVDTVPAATAGPDRRRALAKKLATPSTTSTVVLPASPAPAPVTLVVTVTVPWWSSTRLPEESRTSRTGIVAKVTPERRPAAGVVTASVSTGP